MAVTLNKLREKDVKSLGPGLHGDGGGLYLAVSESGARSWIFRYADGKKQKKHGLGPIHTITLTEAREKALLMRKALADGRRPDDALRPESRTFAEAFEALKKARGKAWSNQKHAKQWDSTLGTYAKTLLDMPVNQISTEHVVEVLNPVWHRIPETSRRLQQRIEAILSVAITLGWREYPNPGAWKDNLANIFATKIGKAKARVVKHHRALDYKDAPEFMYELRQRPALSARMFELAVLTGSRSQEVRLARWQHFDIKEGIWTKPAEIMKAGRSHVVILGPAALELVKSVRALGLKGDFVFPNTQRRTPKAMSNMTLLALLDRMGWRERTTAHGFRSVLNTWATEETDHAQIVVDLALAHEIESKVEKAYRRGDLADKRLALLKDWEAFLSSYKPPAA